MQEDYNMQEVHNQMTVGRYIPKKEMLIYNESLLLHEAYKTLQVKGFSNLEKWIDGYVIDVFVFAQIDDWRDVTYVPTSSTSLMIGDCSEHGHKLSLKRKNEGKNERKQRISIFNLWILLERKKLMRSHFSARDDG